MEIPSPERTGKELQRGTRILQRNGPEDDAVFTARNADSIASVSIQVPTTAHLAEPAPMTVNDGLSCDQCRGHRRNWPVVLTTHPSQYSQALKDADVRPLISAFPNSYLLTTNFE
jgi:hypothetical protein